MFAVCFDTITVLYVEMHDARSRSLFFTFKVLALIAFNLVIGQRLIIIFER